MDSIAVDIKKIYSGRMPVPRELAGKRILLLGSTGLVLSYAVRFFWD